MSAIATSECSTAAAENTVQTTAWRKWSEGISSQRGFSARVQPPSCTASAGSASRSLSAYLATWR